MVMRVVSPSTSTTVLAPTSAGSSRLTHSSAAAAINVAQATMRFGAKAGASIRRWRSHRAPSVVITLAPCTDCMISSTRSSFAKSSWWFTSTCRAASGLNR